MMRALSAAGLAVMMLAPAVAAEPRWQRFHAVESGFSAAFPGTPAAAAPVGDAQLLQRAYQLDLGDRIHEVAVIELPPGNRPRHPDKAFFATLIDNYARGSGTELKSTKPRKIAGQRGSEAVLWDERNGTHHLVDITVSGARIYMVVSAGPGAFEKSRAAARFRNSFRIDRR